MAEIELATPTPLRLETILVSGCGNKERATSAPDRLFVIPQSDQPR
jgi:hypothetical protein